MKTKFVVLFVLVYSFAIAQSSNEEEQNFLDSLKMGGVYLIGKSIPDFKIYSNQGKAYTNKDLENKITVINFWFEACAPCITEMRILEQLFQYFKPNSKFQFLSITYDERVAVNRIAEKNNLSFPIISTTYEICNELNFGKGYPTTIIIDESAKIFFFHSGGTTDPVLTEAFFKGHIYPILNCLLKCR